MSESQAAPIVLVHGILGFNQITLGGLRLADYFHDIPEALRQDGHVVPFPPQLNHAGSVAERAQDLKDYLQEPSRAEVFDKKVHIIAHSMGGLDSRFMIAKLGMADRVLSLTTIGTPHHGSPIADIVVKGTNPVLRKFVEHFGIEVEGLFDLTTDACRRFNDEVDDIPGVRYFSAGGNFNPQRVLGVPQGPLGIPHDLVAKAEGRNDGLVSVASTMMSLRPAWTMLDVWEANHYRMINWGENFVPLPPEKGDNSIVDKYRALAKQLTGAA